MGRIFSSGSYNSISTVSISCLKLSLRKIFRDYVLPITVTIAIVFPSGVVCAADKKLIPGITVGGAYDDNLLFTEENKINTSIVTVTPSLELDYQTLVSNLELSAEWDILRYLDESDYDRTNHYYRLSGNHRIAERWNTSGNFRFYRDTLLNSYLQEIGRVVDRAERDYLDLGGTVGYDVTTISWISAGYRYRNATYEGDVYSDYDNHNVNLNYWHRLKNQIDTLSIGPTYYRRTNDLNDVDSYALDLGWNRDWSRITSSDASIGARYTKVKRDDGTENDSWGARARLDFDFEGPVTITRIRYFHDLRTTVDGDDVNVDNFHLDYSRLVTEKLGLGFTGRLVFSYKLLDQQSDIDDERYYWFEPRLFYRLTQNLDISLRYRYQNNVEFRDEGDVTRERNIVWLQFGYDLPFLL